MPGAPVKKHPTVRRLAPRAHPLAAWTRRLLELDLNLPLQTPSQTTRAFQHNDTRGAGGRAAGATTATGAAGAARVLAFEDE